MRFTAKAHPRDGHIFVRTKTMAIKSSFSPTAGVLTFIDDATSDTIVTSRDAAGQILVNGGAVIPVAGTPTLAKTSLIQGFGQAGNATTTISEAKGAVRAGADFGGCHRG